MADLPAGCALIPNPINQVPGFSLARHWFLPGFPEMAWPMAEWVLDQHYGRARPVQESAVQVIGIPESQLIPLMTDLGAAFPDLKMFSLPHLGADPHIYLGFRGRVDLAPAMDALRARLTSESMPFQEGPDRGGRPSAGPEGEPW